VLLNKYVNKFKYLGHIINNDEHDDKDMLRKVIYLLVGLAYVQSQLKFHF